MKRPIYLILLCLGSFYTLQAQILFEDTSSLLVYPTIKSGAPIGVVDMNGDGLDDIVTLDHTSHLYIQYQNDDATFTGFDGGLIAGSQWSICVADVDRNGYNDIFTGGAYSTLKLLKANDTGTGFSTQIIPGDIFLQGSNFVDINNDNHIDIFACHDEGLSQPYRNDGEGNFILDYGLISAESTFPSDNSGNYGSLWTDYDNDGDIDLYISKCRLGVIQPTDGRRMNLLFQNDGQGNYTDVASMAGMLPLAQSWATDFADIDNDGDLDAFIINHDLSCQIRENNDNGTFTNITNSSGILPAVDDAGSGLQIKFEDFDNDGFVDILYTSLGSSHVVLRNNGNKTFSPQPNALSPFDRIHSASTGDLNNDGFIDVYASYGFSHNGASNSVSDRLYFNAGNDNNYFKTLIKGVFSNANGVGARVELYGEWGKQIREVRSGESYGIMTSYVSHFGIGTATSIDSLVIKWPSGVVDVVTNPDINQQLMVMEGEYCVNNADFSYSISQLSVDFEDMSIVEAEEWLWTFGDGNSSTEQNPTHEYETPDVYEVCLQIGGTCITCIDLALNCNSPAASYGTSVTGLMAEFTDQSSADPTSWLWTFGDGNSSTEQNPNHTFSEPGTYVVCLQASNLCGQAQFCDFISIECNIPAANFGFEANELSVDFTDTSEPGANLWFWNFGDGNISMEQNPQHMYDDPGVYNVCFDINNDCGTESICQELTISCTAPEAGFEFNAQYLIIDFSNQSTAAAETFLWTFGDGESSNLENPSHTYEEQGTYQVCLTVSNICGENEVCQELTFSCLTPTANFVSNATELSVNFGDISSNDPTNWVWTFGDGETAGGEIVQHTYNQPGTYEVCLTASNNCGNDQVCEMLTISCASPNASFISDANELNVNFQDISLGNPSAWGWTFGDGSFSDLQNPEYSYTLPGNYEVCLTVSSICGSNTSCQNVTVGCLAPVASYLVNPNELDLSFIDQSTNNPEEWLWTFGDGNTSTQQNPNHSYIDPGVYEVCLTASSICGSNQVCQQITVSCSAPQALFSFITSDLNINFNDLTTNNPETWLWAFGDGNSSIEQSPQHSYAEPGTYEVCLEVSSICGTTERCEQLVVNCAAPVPSFSIVYNELNVNFIDQTSNDPTSWIWDFGDGMGSTEQNAQHTYEEPGDYEVCLTTSSNCGTNTVCVPIEINCLAPESAFTFEQMGLTLSFSDLSENDPTSWLWEFGDGTFSINQNPVHTFQSTGLKTVCLISNSLCGADTLCQEIDLIVSTENIVDENQINALLYPNPGKNYIQVEFINGSGIEKTLSVIDVRGKRWHPANNEVGLSEKVELNISSLPAGVYFLEIQSDQGRLLKRFIKL